LGGGREDEAFNKVLAVCKYTCRGSQNNKNKKKYKKAKEIQIKINKKTKNKKKHKRNNKQTKQKTKTLNKINRLIGLCLFFHCFVVFC
jgi:Flp pilus assembly protein TadB